MRHPDPFGCHRVIEPPGLLPQNCWKLDNNPIPLPGETPVVVEVLNVDSSSFRQLVQQSRQEQRSVAAIVNDIVEQRGKLHNPVTGSGGVLLGTLPDGRRIVSLVSLSLTPLRIHEVLGVDEERERIYVRADAILFEKTLYCEIPRDLPEGVSLAVLDVAGAPIACLQLARQIGARNILLLGAGKAGFLVAAGLRRDCPGCRIMAVDVGSEGLSKLSDLRLADRTARVDATRPMDVHEAVFSATGTMADLTINLVNQKNTEAASILATREGGWVYFFSMATSFSQAALTAEGVARHVHMLIGSGYTPGWTDYALNLVRENPALGEFFKQRYG